MTKENKEFIDAYIFMTYENMLKTLEKGRLKVLFPEECNDPFEFMSAPPTKLPDGYTSFDSTHVRKEYGFLSFTKTYKSPTMWSHYADKHKGCCVHFRFPSFPEQEGYDPISDSQKKHPYKYNQLKLEHEGSCFTSYIEDIRTKKTINYPVLWNVRYSEKRENFDGILLSANANENIEYHISKLFITKDKSWEYEQEQRIIIPTSFPTEVEDNLIFVRGFNPYIKSVMLGMHCPYSEGLTQSLINAFTLGEKNGSNITYKDGLTYDDQISVSRVKPTSNTFEVISDEHEDFLKFLNEKGK